MRKLAVAVLGAGMIALAVPGGVAWAQRSGAQRFTIICNGSEGAPCQVVASGVINGKGKDVETGPHSDTFIFPGGKLFSTHTDNEGAHRFNEQSCTGTVKISGTFQITGGTGAYKGASGSGRYRGVVHFRAQRTANGCDEKHGTAVVTIRATGTASLPH